MIRAFALFSVAVACQAASLEWPQFGGPRGNFKTDGTGLANSWPAEGPKVLWKRALGDGYSEVSIDGNVIFTMYRAGNDEVVLAAEAGTGKTIWEYRYDATFRSGMGMENGSGPHATPLVTENGVYAIGILGNLVCLDKTTGKKIWSHNLYAEFNGTFQDRGYAPSPVAYRGLVIMKVGGEGHSFVAFQQKSGTVAWRTVQKFDNSPGTPVLINVDGQDQLVAMMHDDVVAIDPANGRVLWTFPHSQLGAQHQHACLGRRPFAVHLIRVQRRQRGDPADSAGRQNGSIRSLVEQPCACAFFDDRARGRLCLRLKRRLRPSAAHGGGRQDGQDCLARSHISQGEFRLC